MRKKRPQHPSNPTKKTTPRKTTGVLSMYIPKTCTDFSLFVVYAPTNQVILDHQSVDGGYLKALTVNPGAYMITFSRNEASTTDTVIVRTGLKTFWHTYPCVT